MTRVFACVLCAVVGYVCALEPVPQIARDLNDAPRCPPEVGERCRRAGSGYQEFSFVIDGVGVNIDFGDSENFSFKCSGNVTLESDALPRFDDERYVTKATLVHCAPPTVSYAAALGTLRVRVLRDLVLLRMPGTPAPPLRKDHFDGLAHLRRLRIDARAGDVILPPGILAPLTDLQQLQTTRVLLPSDELRRLPSGLVTLEMTEAGLSRVDAAVLSRLPHLRFLLVRDLSRDVTVEATAAPALDSFSLETRTVNETAVPRLRTMFVRASLWLTEAPLCANELRNLSVMANNASSLPARWLKSCPKLQSLSLQLLPARVFNESGVLAGGHALQNLTLRYCQLRELHKGMFDDTTELRSLDLSHNRLLTLSSGIFLRLRHLHTLNLSYNGLHAASLAPLGAATSLRVLRISYNPLGDLCPAGTATIRLEAMSSLQKLTELEELSLSKARVARVCLDWRVRMPRLAVLDLSFGNITHITYSDLQYRRSIEDARVDLSGNEIDTLEYTPSDYDAVIGGAAASQAVVTVDSHLRCDCLTYVAALAIRNRSDHLRLENPLLCQASGRSRRVERLVDVPPGELGCDASNGTQLRDFCPSGCECASRPELWNVTRSFQSNSFQLRSNWRNVLRVSCRGMNSTSPPNVSVASPLPLRELLLPDNRLSEVRVADVPASVRLLDLRNNSVRRVDAALFDGDRELLLAGNPLDCDCDAADSLRAMAARQAGDYRALTCPDGSSLSLFPFDDCVPSDATTPAVAATLAALATAAIALGLVLTRPELRLRLKRALRVCGVLHEADDGRRYDAFLSYSHHDQEIAERIAARLEGGPRPYRLCLHYRDWAPGAWIPRQIAASVEASRRTVAVVSEHYLSSAWARAEFRSAHASALREATPRLVVVLVGDPPRDDLDPELRAFLAANTYVQWGDRWFWEKLERAMPPRRPTPRRAPARSAASTTPETISEAVSSRSSSESSGFVSLNTTSTVTSSNPSLASPEPRTPEDPFPPESEHASARDFRTLFGLNLNPRESHVKPLEHCV